MPIDPQSLAAHIEREIGGLPRFNDVAEILVIVTARYGGRVVSRTWAIGSSGDAIRQAIARAMQSAKRLLRP